MQSKSANIRGLRKRHISWVFRNRLRAVFLANINVRYWSRKRCTSMGYPRRTRRIACRPVRSWSRPWGISMAMAWASSSASTRRAWKRRVHGPRARLKPLLDMIFGINRITMRSLLPNGAPLEFSREDTFRRTLMIPVSILAHAVFKISVLENQSFVFTVFLSRNQTYGNLAEIYGRSLNVYSWNERKLKQTINLGDEGIAPLEIRFLHDPLAAEGFVGCAVPGNVYRFYKAKDDSWKAEKVIQVPPKKVEGWVMPQMSGATHKASLPFKALRLLPKLDTETCICISDKKVESLPPRYDHRHPAQSRR